MTLSMIAVFNNGGRMEIAGITWDVRMTSHECGSEIVESQAVTFDPGSA